MQTLSPFPLCLPLTLPTPQIESLLEVVSYFPRAIVTNLKQQKLNSLTLLEAESLKWRCCQVWFPLGFLRENPSHTFLLASGGRPKPLALLALQLHSSS